MDIPEVDRHVKLIKPILPHCTVTRALGCPRQALVDARLLRCPGCASCTCTGLLTKHQCSSPSLLLQRLAHVRASQKHACTNTLSHVGGEATLPLLAFFHPPPDSSLSSAGHTAARPVRPFSSRVQVTPQCAQFTSTSLGCRSHRSAPSSPHPLSGAGHTAVCSAHPFFPRTQRARMHG